MTNPAWKRERFRHVTWFVVFLFLAAGCQTSPGRPAGCTRATENVKPSTVLVQQIVCDTGEEITHHPLRAGRTAFADQADWFTSVRRGIFGKRIGMGLHGCPPPVGCCAEGLDPALIETNLQPASVQLYREGGDALAVLEQMIDSAVCRIDVLMYIWEDDPVGWQIAHHVAARASPECRVRILIDGGANLIFEPQPGTDTPTATSAASAGQKQPKTAGELNRVVCWLAQQPCIELVRIRNPCGHFDHRKLVLVDGQSAWAGGRNFTDQAFFVRHDISFTMQGPLVAQWQAMYERYWRDQGGKPACISSDTPPITANAAGRLVGNSPTHHSLRQALYRALEHARCTAWLENPYFTDNGVITKLAAARRRGVDARVILTIRSDSQSINHVNRVTANRLLAAGVRVYLYPGRVHTKAALVDGCWAYLGSGNFDILSLSRNHELGVVFGPCPIVNELQQILFERDFEPDWELHSPLPLTAQDYAYEMLAAFFL